MEYLSKLPPSKITNSPGCALSKRFFEAFRQGIQAAAVGDLQKIARSRTERTQFYAEYLLPKIADELGLAHVREEFKVDHVGAIYSANEHAVPRFFVESENDFTGAIHEIRKLCSLNSPLRVLITFTTKQFTPEPAAGGLIGNCDLGNQ
ncbi:hypothetical protein [Steroidobacter cummioxidans]|uniref:hypothetical protein n=1 Tax=Steroidobacter cummioxidans TaxID=1803913 RepID=UPI00128FCD76|nr:hypothetical protein [Steroidobacter cummioxidans]